MDITEELFINHPDKENIKYLKKPEYETYYSKSKKWPYLVIERLSMNTGNPSEGYEKVKRDNVEDPFKPDPELSPEDCFTKDDYNLMMSYGLSPGHNAPAGHHHTRPDIWESTFLYSNICPQEMVFNSGVWVILENWCKYISKQQKYKNFTNLRVFTGSIADKNNTILKIGDKSLSVNIPTHMYKIVCARSKNSENNNKLFISCFVYPNRPINPILEENQELSKWMVPFEYLKNLSNLNFKNLFKGYYNQIYKSEDVEFVNLNELVSVKFNLSDILKKQMTKSLWYGMIIYSSNLEELDLMWSNCQKVLKDENLEYHKEFYDLAKKRLLNKNNKNNKDKNILDKENDNIIKNNVYNLLGGKKKKKKTNKKRINNNK
jgi:DNA/RNA endonuclease G (NUC1)